MDGFVYFVWPACAWFFTGVCGKLIFPWCLRAAAVQHICMILQGEMDHSFMFINSLSNPGSVKENAANASISILSLFLQNYNDNKKCPVFSVTKIGEVPAESVQLH